MNDSFNLQRFVDAQDPVYSQVREELSRGRKRSHWMWFVFPQLKGLGHSWMADKYGLASKGEAVAYVEHPVLGPRLRECSELINAVENQRIDAILGYPDNLKFRSCMTLFVNMAPENESFHRALEKYFDGKPDKRTIELL